MELISTTEFVLRQGKIRDLDNFYDESDEYFNRCEKYANFINGSLKLGMFVPCKEDGSTLKEPEWWYRYQNGASPFMNMDEIRPCQEYKKALENILFECFSVEGDNLFTAFIRSGTVGYSVKDIETEMTAENLISDKLKLTPNAIKLLGL